jgi:long-chain acyl-CoA synthetase
VSAITTVASRLAERAGRQPGAVALREKDLGLWRDITWSEYWDTVADVAHALLALGLEAGDRVAVHSENRPEWVYADLATVAIRGTTMGLYPTNPPSEVAHLLSDSGARVLIAEDQEQVDKALSVRDRLPHLERIVFIESRGLRTYDDPLLMPWEEFVDLGRRHRAAHPGAVEARMAQARPDDVMSLFYTSGTTGPPKGAMLTVANVEFAIEKLILGGGWVSPPPTEADSLLSYLPLAHIAERIFSVWFNLAAGCLVHFAESVDTVQADLREIQPTIFLGVPRIWEKLHAGIHIRGANASALKRANLRLWLMVAERIATRRLEQGGRHSVATRALSALGFPFAYRHLQERIGLRRCRYAISGSATIPPDIVRFFWGIGVPVYQAYGQTEGAGVAAATRPGRVKLGLVGEPVAGAEVRLDEATGEILVRHPGVFAGYWGNPEATAKAKTADGWLRTGDVGRFDGTHLDVTDRLKDVITTAGGEALTPSEIENALKTSPYVRDAVVIGAGRPYLTALIGIELDTVGDWAKRRSIPYTTYRDLTEKPAVLELVGRVVEAVSDHLPEGQRLRQFRLLPKQLDHEDGELTATQKVKRSAIAALFAPLVEGMYEDRDGVVEEVAG